MVDTLDTYIKSPAPPREPNAQYVYNEQQFGSIERALQKHHDKILDVNENAIALYENEVSSRTTADSAIVQTIEALGAKVDLNDTNTQATISNIQTAMADTNTATASSLSALEAKVDSGDATNLALIRNEATTRATKLEALASQVSAIQATVKTNAVDSRAMINKESQTRTTALNAEAVSRSNLSAYVGYTDGQAYTKTLAATISDEESARVDADTAVAQRVMSTSAGTSRVYSQTTAPGNVSGQPGYPRQTGDIWIDTTVPAGSTSPNLKPYVWYNSAWRDNSTGTYSQYAGLNATINQISTVVYDPTGGNSSYEWIVKGRLGTNSLGQSAIRLTGAQKPNGSGGYTTTSKFIIDADTEINGSLLVSGTITGSKITTDGVNGVNNYNIINNAVSQNAYAQGINTPSNPVTVSLNLRPNARVSILVSYAGGDDQNQTGSDGTITCLVNDAAFTNNTQPITHSMIKAQGTYAYGTSYLNGLLLFYLSNPSSMLTFYTAGSSGGTYVFKAFASSNFNQRISLLVTELSK